MASIKYSPIVSQAAGLVGGTVFAQGSNGAYIRTFRKGVNKNTSVQQVKRNNLSFYAARWRQLTDEDRNAWITGAASAPYANRLGEKSTYTGYQYFMKTNLTLESAALDE